MRTATLAASVTGGFPSQRVSNAGFDISLKNQWSCMSWWRHQMETFSGLLAICAGNSPVAGEFPAQRPVTQSFDIFFDLRLNKRLSEQSWGWWFDTLSRPLCRLCNVVRDSHVTSHHIPKSAWIYEWRSPHWKVGNHYESRFLSNYCSCVTFSRQFLLHLSDKWPNLKYTVFPFHAELTPVQLYMWESTHRFYRIKYGKK